MSSALQLRKTLKRIKFKNSRSRVPDWCPRAKICAYGLHRDFVQAQKGKIGEAIEIEHPKSRQP